MNEADVRRLCPRSGWRDFGELLRALAVIPESEQSDLVAFAQGWLESVVEGATDDRSEYYQRLVHSGLIPEIWPEFPNGTPPSALRLVREAQDAPAEARQLAALLDACPALEGIEFCDALSEPALEALVQAPSRERIRFVHIDQDEQLMDGCEERLPPRTLAAILSACPAIEDLTIAGGLDDEALRALTGVVPGPKLKKLMLRDNKLTSEGIAALAKVPFESLTDLCLGQQGGFELDLDALRHIAASPHLRTLEELRGFYMFGAEARSIVEASPYLDSRLLTDF